MKLIEQLAKKARSIGVEVEVLSARELKVIPKSKEQKQHFYKEYRQFQAEHPKLNIEIAYDYTQLIVLSNDERKKEIRKIHDFVKQFGGFIEVEDGFRVHCFMSSEGRAEVIRKNRYKWFDLVFWLDDRQERKSQLYLTVKVLYADGKALAFSERKKLFQRLEAFSKSYHADFDILSQSELLVTANTEKRQQTLQNYMKKYQGLRVYTTDDHIEELSIHVRHKERTTA